MAVPILDSVILPLMFPSISAQDSEIECRDSAGSNRAAARLADLKHLAAEQGIATDFSLRFAAIREHPARKRQFIARLDAL